ncbi:MAG: hypothetical protein H7A20_01070 [Rhodanobacteraceae bacterium]|nr:hypothetical protein [Rhodanobacteraceae bacterium]
MLAASASAVSDWFDGFRGPLSKDGWKNFVVLGWGSGDVAVGLALQHWGRSSSGERSRCNRAMVRIWQSRLDRWFSAGTMMRSARDRDDENGQGHQLVMRRGNGNGVASDAETIATFCVRISVGFIHGDARFGCRRGVLLRFETVPAFLRNTAGGFDRQRPAQHWRQTSSVTRLEVAGTNRDWRTLTFSLQPGANT